MPNSEVVTLALPAPQGGSVVLGEEEGSGIRSGKAGDRLLDRKRVPDAYKLRLMRAFLTSLERQGRVDQACRESGLTPVRLMHWKQEFGWFNRRIDEARLRLVERVEDTVMEVARDGSDMATARWVLERRAPERWGKSNDKGNGPPLTINIEQNVYDSI